MRFTPAQHDSACSSDIRVLFAARLLWDKGLQEFVDAIRELREQGGEAHFLIAGKPDDGNPAAVPAAQVQSWQDEGLVEWLGHVDDMAELYRSTDIMVLPSYREGLPKGLIEAAACGLPLVTTDVPGCREVVEDGETGILVNPHDSSALAEAIARLLNDRNLRLSMGRSGREKVLAEFDEKIVIRKTLAVYRELLPE